MSESTTISDADHDHEHEHGDDTDIIFIKIGAGLGIIFLSILFGYLPLVLAKKIDFQIVETDDEEIAKKQRNRPQNVILSFLLNLGGGVLLANCFCHWLPEVREGLKPTFEGKTELPVSELIMCAGFLFIFFLEEFLHYIIRPRKAQKVVNSYKMNPASDLDTDFAIDNRRKHVCSSDQECEEGEEDSIQQLKLERSNKQFKSALRTFFIVSALSFHSTIEGLALSLEEESAGVLMNAAATSLHKFVISFSVGVELIANKASLMHYNISILVFSFAPAVGVTIGLVLKDIYDESGIDDLPIQILQGIATGTVIYVVFFEIFPKGKSIGGTGFQHVLSIALGFGLFVPSLFLHSAHDHGSSEGDHDHEAFHNH